MRPLMIHLCAAALLVAGLPAVADAYCVRVADKKTIRWNKPPVSYRVSSSLTDKALLTAIDNAFKTWASASCAGLSFKKGSSFKVCTDPKCKEFDNPDGAIFVHWVTGTSTLFKNPTPKGQPYFANFSFTFDKTGDEQMFKRKSASLQYGNDLHCIFRYWACSRFTIAHRNGNQTLGCGKCSCRTWINRGSNMFQA